MMTDTTDTSAEAVERAIAERETDADACDAAALAVRHETDAEGLRERARHHRRHAAMLRALLARAEKAEAERDRLAEAQDAAARVLHKAGEQFAFYANEHAKKGTPDGDVKAATNQQWAQRCFNAHDVALKEPAHD